MSEILNIYVQIFVQRNHVRLDTYLAVEKNNKCIELVEILPRRCRYTNALLVCILIILDRQEEVWTTRHLNNKFLTDVLCFARLKVHVDVLDLRKNWVLHTKNIDNGALKRIT